ncbi:hypothetical protein J7T55_014902 [Diaporthe amygdali]|uniref:uncharacterized protein n=1 Tax=Phomopsis amygdali TaxID=1214568 RepID=UPI0022FEA1F3|nr:uncharacterized protein J7T55_014902 [Diaporthe amygdali]KAJ0110099.1 hypothetical protein J7T55_014902 [Diaporthe amygdali]
MPPTTRHRASKRATDATASSGTTHSKGDEAKRVTDLTKEQPKAEDIPAKGPQNGTRKTKAAKHKDSQRAMRTMRSKLVKRLDAFDQDEIADHQARLLRRASIALAGEGLGLPVVLDAATSADMLVPTKVMAPHRCRPARRGRAGKGYVDAGEILGLDENDELGLSARHIPQIGLRRRVGRKPAKVPFSLWMAYHQMDDFIYRNSLSKEEVVALPTDDDVFDFHIGGDAPSLPPDFAWDDKKRLVDRRPLEQHDE